MPRSITSSPHPSILASLFASLPSANKCTECYQSPLCSCCVVVVVDFPFSRATVTSKFLSTSQQGRENLD